MGGGSLTVEVVSFMLEKNNRLTISRMPDQYSSRFATLANFNKSKRALMYGFTEMNLIVNTSSDTGDFVSHRVYFFTGIAVEQTVALGVYEAITFAFNDKSEFCLGQC